LGSRDGCRSTSPVDRQSIWHIAVGLGRSAAKGKYCFELSVDRQETESNVVPVGVGCLKITKRQVIKSRVPNSRRRANLSHHCSTKARGSKPASQPSLQHQGAWVETRVSASRREARHPRLSTKARGPTPASQHQGAGADTRISATKARDPTPASQHQGA